MEEKFMEVLPTPFDNYFCSLIGKEIDVELCYDVQMIRHRFIKMSALDFEFDRDNAHKLCENCFFNQLKDK